VVPLGDVTNREQEGSSAMCARTTSILSITACQESPYAVVRIANRLSSIGDSCCRISVAVVFTPRVELFETLNVLTLVCPFCRHEHTDDFECLDSGRADMILCENSDCKKQFAFLVRECLTCGEESVFTWEGMPTAEALAALFCEHCGANPNEASREAEDENATQRIQ
jgi:hypothetical protein